MRNRILSTSLNPWERQSRQPVAGDEWRQVERLPFARPNAHFSSGGSLALSTMVLVTGRACFLCHRLCLITRIPQEAS